MKCLGNEGTLHSSYTSRLKVKQLSGSSCKSPTFVMHHAFIMENVNSSSVLSESLQNVNTTCDIHNKSELLRADLRPDKQSTNGGNVLIWHPVYPSHPYAPGGHNRPQGFYFLLVILLVS